MLDAPAYLENHPLLALVAVIAWIMGGGRLARVITYDDFPPANWARLQWTKLTKGGPWAKLFHCQWCMTPWLMAISLIWAVFSDLHWSWWAFWGTLGAAYIASIIVHHDED